VNILALKDRLKEACFTVYAWVLTTPILIAIWVLHHRQAKRIEIPKE
jgi:hypothetical protein